ncbi:cation:proton antiporter [Nibricoccus sp. IMCC34717]|uniref:cation:proton antiporter domain-containing protein n=1 Tax=Nibricoccus sp. IMCC34717 TaxID=3034021 RepID=UPI00384E65D8
MADGISFIQDLAIILLVAGAVGWGCRRIGLSVVVGYLLAGMVVGPHTPPFSLVHDIRAVETLAQLGVVFLMFSIGLKLSLRKLRRLGFSLLAAVFIGAALVYSLARFGGALAGWSAYESLFLGAMLVVSSSAIVTKVLQEAGDTHERSGQLAVGVTVLEDVVAVVTLTLLNSMISLGPGARTAVGETLGLFGAFVVLAGVLGLLLLPGLLRRMSKTAGEEVQTIGLAGILFGLALIAQKAGYSLALGAFLLGTIVAETPHRVQVERTFEGMRDIFTAVFFVAIGMQIQPVLLAQVWPEILAVTAFTILVRTFAVTVGLSLIGKAVKDSMRAGMAATPIGEFSFIIVQLGVMAGLVSAKLYAIAVGVSLMTALLAPFLVRRSEAVAMKLLSVRPIWMEEWHNAYYVWLEQLRSRRKASLLWQLSRKRLIQIAVEMLFVSGILIFSESMREAFLKWLGRDWLFHDGPTFVFWTALALVISAPLVALWRNISALSLLYAQVTVQDSPNASRLAPGVELVYKAVAAGGLIVWLTTLIPMGPSATWILGVSLLIAVAASYFLWRKLIFWHSQLEVELHGMLEGPRQQSVETAAPWINPRREWRFEVSDCILPDLAAVQGKSIGELELRSRFGLTVVGIERQGCLIALPGPQTRLFPRDKLLMIGPPGEIARGKTHLTEVSGELPVSEFDDLRMEMVVVPVGSLADGKTLRELAPAQSHHVQIAGVRRGETRVLNPGGDERLGAGDEILVLGTPDQINGFKDWLEPDEGVKK